MYTFTMVFHIIACLALILIVLLQTGRGAEMGAAFGGASQTLFGGSGGNTFLTRLTTGAAIVFMLTCLGLTYMSSGPSTRSVMENAPVDKPQGPALPEATPVQPSPGQPPEARTPAAEPAPEAGKEPVKSETPPPAEEGAQPAKSGAKQ